MQINAAQAMNATPQTMAFTLPDVARFGYAQAHIAIDRDAPGTGRTRNLDGDNFHIAFILDTKHLGTVSGRLADGRPRVFASGQDRERSHRQTFRRFADDRLTGRLE